MRAQKTLRFTHYGDAVAGQGVVVVTPTRSVAQLGHCHHQHLPATGR